MVSCRETNTKNFKRTTAVSYLSLKGTFFMCPAPPPNKVLDSNDIYGCRVRGQGQKPGSDNWFMCIVHEWKETGTCYEIAEWTYFEWKTCWHGQTAILCPGANSSKHTGHACNKNIINHCRMSEDLNTLMIVGRVLVLFKVGLSFIPFQINQYILEYDRPDQKCTFTIF